LSYFKINNQKYNYLIEFNSLNITEKWKTSVPIIEYCSQIGVKIPHYCYHKNLSIAGNCRICLIELKQSNKPIISCAINAKNTLLPNIEIFTNSPLVKKSRENILEFLLLNHPLDCPICDQGGECDLQDQSLFFGFTKKRFYNYKRIVTDKNIGPLIKTVMTRCIHCTRCVRFGNEIAGIQDLGIFGRSLNSEIGTYVNKTFQSEISGNVIDICPVGALTSKVYSYIGRNWEIKGINSIDFSDGFCLNIKVQIKNSKIIKIQPNLNENKIDWISDKTRFSFDMLFPSESFRKVETYNKNWHILFKKLMKLFYFYDHLSKHSLKLKPLTLIFGETLNNESINLLIFLSKKYKFVKIRRDIFLTNNTDIEQYFKLNNLTSYSSNFNVSKFCFLIGLNPRYEGFYLNLKLRQRQLKGNFKIFNMNSLLNLTYNTKTISNNTQFLKLISEGNHVLSQNFKSSTKPILILNHQLSNRTDNIFFLKSIFNLEIYSKLKSQNWNGINYLSNSINTVGIDILNIFTSFSTKDFLNSSGLFFLNSITSESFCKMLQLKLLNYIIFKITDFKTKHFSVNLGPYISSNKIYQYLDLPSSNFFENSGSFINTEGIFKQSIKILTTNLGKKNDWEILRIIIANSNKIELLHTNHQKLFFLNWNLNRFRNFIIFLNYASTNISNSSFFLHKKSQVIKHKIFKFQKSKTKLLNTKLKRYIYDFYLANESYYSKFSFIMIKCSNNFRVQKTNFENFL
jgi:NADH-quinone oxidoreductase subunit G